MVDLQPDGLLRTRGGTGLQSALVVAPTELELIGKPLAQAPRSTDTTGLTLWQAERPVRVSTVRAGVQPNGDISGLAQITVYACRPGSLELTLFGKVSAPVEVRVNGNLRALRILPPNAVWTESVAAPEDADGRSSCLFELETPGLIGSTRIEFVRA